MNALTRSALIACVVLASLVAALPLTHAQDSSCSSAPEQYLQVGITAWVVPGGTPNNLRAGPGMSHRRLSQMPPGERFTITDGPVCADGYRWWLVLTESGREGWTADGKGDERWLETDAMDSPEPLPGLPEAVTLGGLLLNNRTGVAICSLYWTPSHQPSPDWSSNPLEGDPLPADDHRLTDLVIPPGEYDIWVGDCNGDVLYTIQEIEVVAGNFTVIIAGDSTESEPPADCPMERNPDLRVNDVVTVSDQYTGFVDAMKAALSIGTPGVAVFASWDADAIATYAYGPDGTMQTEGSLGVGETAVLTKWPVCVGGLLYWETSAGFILDGIQGRWGATQFQAYFLEKSQAQDEPDRVYITGVNPLQESAWLQLYASGNFDNDFRDGQWVAVGNGVYAGRVPNPAQGFVNLYVEAYCGDLNYSATFCSISLSGNSAAAPYRINACDPATACNGLPSGRY